MELCFDLLLDVYFFCYQAGKKTTDEELEEMLESGNPSIFTSGVSDHGTMDREGHGGDSLPWLHRSCSCAGAELMWVGGLCSGSLLRGLLMACLYGACCRSSTRRFPSKPSVRLRVGTRTS